MSRYGVLLGLLCLFIGCQCATIEKLDIGSLDIPDIDAIVTKAFQKANEAVKSKGLAPLSTGNFSKSFEKRVFFATLKVSLEGWASINGLDTLRREEYCGIRSITDGTSVGCTVQYGPVEAKAYFAAELPLIGKRKLSIGLKFPKFEAGLNFTISNSGKVSIKKFQLLPFVNRPEITDTAGIPSVLLDFLVPVTNFLDNFIFDKINFALGAVSTIVQGFITQFLPK